MIFFTVQSPALYAVPFTITTYSGELCEVAQPNQYNIASDGPIFRWIYLLAARRRLKMPKNKLHATEKELLINNFLEIEKFILRIYILFYLI